MPRTYVDNAYNRRVGRVGLPVGSAVISKNTIGGFNTRTYADNAKNRSLGRVGLPHGSAVESKYCSGLTQWHYLDERLPRTYKQENIYDHFGTGDIYQQDNTWKTRDDASHRELFSTPSRQARKSSDESSSLVGHKPDIYNRQASAESRHTNSSGGGSIENLPGKLERQRTDYTVLLAQKNSLDDECERLKEDITREKKVSKADKEQAVVSLREQNTTLRGKLEKQREENAVLLGQKNSLHDLCEKLKEELTRMKLVAKEDKEQAVVSLRELNMTLQSKLETQRKENAILLGQVKSLDEKLKEELTRMKVIAKADKEKAIVSNTTLERMLKTFSDEKASLLEQKSILEETCQKLKEEITCLNRIAKEQRKQTNSAVSQLRTDFQTQVDDQQERIRSLEASLGSLQTYHQVAIATIQKLQGELKYRDEAIADLQQEKADHEQQIRTINGQLKTSREIVLPQKDDVINRLSQQISTLQSKLKGLVDEVAFLRRENSILQGLCKPSEDKLRHMKNITAQEKPQPEYYRKEINTSILKLNDSFDDDDEAPVVTDQEWTSNIHGQDNTRWQNPAGCVTM